jgi:hypothetical protein
MNRSFHPDVHERLERAVLDVFSNADFHQASIRDVADQAGILFDMVWRTIANPDSTGDLLSRGREDGG